jgi:hypothetical protein
MQRCLPPAQCPLRCLRRCGSRRALAACAAQQQQRVVLQPTPRCKSLAKAAELTLATFVVGSGAEAQVRVADAAVTALHVRFDWRAGRLFVTDLESSGGTHFDGTCIRAGVAYSAANGVVLCLGDPAAPSPTEFTIQLEPLAQQAGSADEMLAQAFLQRFRASGTDDVKKLLDE